MHTKPIGQGVKRIILVIILLLALLPILGLFEVYTSDIQEILYHDVHQSEILTIQATVTKEQIKSDGEDDDRYLYVSYTLPDRNFKNIEWKTDNSKHHKVGDTVSVEVYPNGRLVETNLGGVLVTAGIMILMLYALVGAAVKGLQKSSQITQRVMMQALHKKAFLSNAGWVLMAEGLGLGLNCYLLNRSEKLLVWFIAVFALGVVALVLSVIRTLKKAGTRLRWVTDICTSCVDNGDSESTHWESTFENTPGLFSLGHLAVRKKYWLLLNEKNTPELAYECDRYTIDKEDALDGRRNFLKGVVLRTLLLMVVTVLYFLILYYLCANGVGQ